MHSKFRIDAMPAAVATRDVLEQELKLAVGERLYAVIDAAQDFTFVHVLRWEHQCDAKSLFQGDAADDTAHVAPYLVSVASAGAVLDLWIERLGKNVGILLVSPADPDALLTHLRQVFVITDEAGQEYFFRFYDPRVLRSFVPTCTPAERATFFGPVERTVVENESADGYLTFARQ
jgi:hypothetical protein